ncbi:uncharacterized protein [Drosophila bipectinata]|uniref:uncharacterized protein n=1 Tax=Drosophila bipectinata TaxID=42026 RepID=UPI001C88F1DF|nr:uncharacterized protein LOC108131858 [Drosophila bipectinata]
MKVLNVCLLIVASASFLLATANANAIGYDDLAMTGMDKDMDGMDMEGMDDMDFMDFEPHGFVGGCWKVLKAGFHGVNGTMCIVDETAHVVLDCTSYVKNVAKCTTAMPKDVLAIVNTASEMITLGNSLTQLNTLCAKDENSSSFWLKNWVNCGRKMFITSMKIVRRMNSIIKNSAKLPKDTSNCYITATQSVVDSCNAYMPNINQCIAIIKGQQ